MWVTTPAGKPMPLDAVPVLMWLIDADGPQSGSTKAKPIYARPSHFAKCPNADQHRRDS